MPRTELAPQRPNIDGLELQLAPANVDGYTVPLDQRYALVFANAGTTAVTLTVPTPQQVHGLDIADRTITIPAGATRFLVHIGSHNVYAQPGGWAHLNFSDVTSLTVALVIVG